MQQLEALINSYVVEDDPKQCQQLSKDIIKGSNLLEIVKALESPLTQEDSLVRAKATQLLADVVYNHPSLRPQEMAVLSVFLSDRLHDLDSISAAASGLETLTTKPGFRIPGEDDEEFWRKLRDVDLLHVEVGARYQVFKLLRALASKPNKTFVSTFVALASGEKDPRNLMLNLETSRHILESIGDTLTQDERAEIYDITFCYFPIKFNPPKDMPYKISTDEIREALKLTLSSPALAQWTVPGLISKLTAVNVNVKLDALAALDSLAGNLSNDGTTEYYSQIWDGLKYEILHGTPESETFKPVIQVLTKLVDIPEFLQSVLAELENACSTKAKLLQYCHLVVGLSINETVWETLAPKVIEKCYENPRALNLFITPKYAVPHADQVFQALLTFLANGEKRDSLQGLTKFALSPDSGDYVPLIVQTFTNEEAYANLAELAPTFPGAIQEHSLPQLLSKIPDSLVHLGDVCCVRSLLHALTVRLLSRLDLQEESSSLQLLNTLLAASNHLKTPEEFVGYDRILIPSLLAKFKEAAESKIEVNDRVTNAACDLIERAARGVQSDRQPVYAADLVNYVDKVHFHLIVSGVAPMKEYPLTTGFSYDEILTRLEGTSHILERAAYLRLLALIANKWVGTPAAEAELKAFCEDKLQARVTARDNNAIEAYAWLTKGLLFRNSAQGFANAEFLTQLATTDSLVAKVYGVIDAEDRVVSKINGLSVRPLFRQRLFVASLPKLSEKSGSRESLTALSSLLKYTPHTVVISHFSQILPMLRSSLHTDVASLQESSLECIFNSLPESAPTLEIHFDNLIPRILELSVSSPSAKARALALQIIISLHEKSPETVAEYKATILEGVKKALGDKKREVRKHAVKCCQIFT